MGRDCWAELGLSGPTDASAIRRAYATRLKSRRAETDPQGFMRLRAAYEAALAWASSGDADGDDHGERDDEGQGAAPEGPGEGLPTRPSVPIAPTLVPSPLPEFAAAMARQHLQRLQARLARTRQQAVAQAARTWMEAFAARVADATATTLPPFPRGADLAFAESLESQLAATLEAAAGDVSPGLWLSLERRFGWDDDRHPIWREHPWLMARRDAARQRREERTRWTRFLATRGIVLDDDPESAAADRAGDPGRPAPVTFGVGPAEVRIAWRTLDAPPGRTGRPSWRQRLRAYDGRVAEAVASLLDQGQHLAPGFWEARAAPATLAYWTARSRRHRGLGWSPSMLVVLFFGLPVALVLLGFFLQGDPSAPVAVSSALLGGGLVFALGLEPLSRLRWFMRRQGERLAIRLAPLRRRSWPYALASLGVAAAAVAVAPPMVSVGPWGLLVALAVVLGWLGLGLPSLSVLGLLGFSGVPVDLALLDWAERDAALRPVWAWAPLVILANRWGLWQAMTRLPGLILRRLPPARRKGGGAMVLLVAALWLLVLPLALRHALALPPLSAGQDAPPPTLPVPRQPGSAPTPRPFPADHGPVLPPLQET